MIAITAALGLARLSAAILVGDGRQDEQIRHQSDHIDGLVAGRGICNEQDAKAIHALDQKSRAESQEQRVASLSPELEEEGGGDQRGRDDDADEKPLDHGWSLSKMSP